MCSETVRSPFTYAANSRLPDDLITAVCKESGKPSTNKRPPPSPKSAKKPKQSNKLFNNSTSNSKKLTINFKLFTQASREQRLLEQQQYEKRHNELEQKNHKLQENWMNILTENTQLKSEREQLHTAQEKLTKDYSTLRKNFDNIQVQLTEAKQLASEKQQLAQHWQVQCQISQEKGENQQIKIIELEKCTAAFSKKIKLWEEKIAELTSHNKMLAHDKWILDQEKAQLMQ